MSVRPLEGGGVLFIPAGTIHAATKRCTNNGVELATNVVEDKPLVVMVK